jgi:pterin-4a-carbinolamine dehydratase/extradiol dioxygenase family protein
MRVQHIDHIVLCVSDLERMVQFYCDVLGCSVERRSAGEFGLVQLRAGRSLIDLIPAHGALEGGDGSPGGGARRNLHHFCVRVQPFEEEELREHLARHGISCGELKMNYGAEGKGPTLYFEDPEGNIVELKGPAIIPEEDAAGLAGERCEACRPDAPRVTEREIAELSRLIPEWKIVEREGIERLERSFRFPDFMEALAFTNRVAEAAEREGHHPDILTTWGAVTVTWWSHKIRGLHRSDFVMAAKTDALFR